MKYLSFALFLFIAYPISSQSYFNIVIPSDQNFVEGINHPAMELFGNKVLVMSTVFYWSNYGGTTSISILDSNGLELKNFRFDDSTNIAIPYDCIRVGSDFIVSGMKFISKDTLNELWIVKFNTYGEMVWEKQVRTNYDRPAYFRAIKLKENPGIALCGVHDQIDPASIGGASLTSHGLVVITDSLGEIIHFVEVNDLDTTTLEGYYGIAEDKDGNIYACGTIFPNSLNNDAVVVKVSPDGKLLWRKRIQSLPYNEGVLNIFYQRDGSFLLIGDSYNGDFFGDQFSFTLLYNMDTTGKIIWRKRIMKIYDGGIGNCVQDKTGNFICAGTMKLDPNEAFDGYLVKFSPNGDSIWSRRINNYEGRTEQFFNIANASDGGYYLTGYSWVQGDNSSKAWIVKVDSFGCLVPGCEKTVSVDDIKSGKEKAFSFFPNPVYNKFYLLSRIQERDLFQLKIYNLQGLLVQKYNFKPNAGAQYQVDLNEKLISGHYVIRIESSDGKVVSNEKMEVIKD
jgi:hypothetical protein